MRPGLTFARRTAGSSQRSSSAFARATSALMRWASVRWSCEQRQNTAALECARRSSRLPPTTSRRPQAVSQPEPSQAPRARSRSLSRSAAIRRCRSWIAAIAGSTSPNRSAMSFAVRSARRQWILRRRRKQWQRRRERLDRGRRHRQTRQHESEGHAASPREAAQAEADRVCPRAAAQAGAGELCGAATWAARGTWREARAPETRATGRDVHAAPPRRPACADPGAGEAGAWACADTHAAAGRQAPTEASCAAARPPSQMVCCHTMVRTTVKITDELDARLRHEAQQQGVTISEVTRTALEAHLRVGGRDGRRRLRAAAAGRSGQSDVSERVEQIIAAELARSR